MKILALEKDVESGILKQEHMCSAIACYPDTTLLRNNEDFYIPNFTQNISANYGIFIQISKIGKCIEAQFAYRYIKSFGIAVKFFAADALESNLYSNSIAKGFDKSFAVSKEQIDFSEKTLKEATLSFSCGSIKNTHKLSKISKSIYTFIAESTKYYTLKIGDYCYIPLGTIQNPVSLHQTINGSIDNIDFLNFKIS